MEFVVDVIWGNYNTPMTTKARVIEKLSEQVLCEFNLNQMDKAFAYAKQMEDMGLDVIIDAPDVNKTLAKSLGATEQQWAQYQKSMQEEMDDHDCVGCENQNTKSVREIH